MNATGTARRTPSRFATIVAWSLLATTVGSSFASAFAPTSRPVLRHRRGSSFVRTTTTTIFSRRDDDGPSSPRSSYDVCVVGSGIGGLCAAAVLSSYGYSVGVFESHSAPGGAAHGFEARDDEGRRYRFDTGPSFFSGLNPDLPAKASNPLRTVLDAVGERVECEPYRSFGLLFPEGDFAHTPDFATTVLREVAATATTATTTDDNDDYADRVVEDWERLMVAMRPLEQAVAAMPTAAIRTDVGAALTAGPFLPNFARVDDPLALLKLTGPFQNILDEVDVGRTSPFPQRWVDLLCFCLSGLPANGTITAEMGLMLGEFYDADAVMDAPKGGAKSIVDALVRGVRKHGGEIFCNAHVDEILVENGRATGVRLKKKNTVVRADRRVISNLSVWDLYGGGILRMDDLPSSAEDAVAEKLATPACRSFVHLHLGLRLSREELDDLEAHYMYVEDWERGVDAEDNAVLVSIPSVHDYGRELAPDGFAVLHAYAPATEAYAPRWEGVDRRSPAYARLKEERSAHLWRALGRILPDARDRATLVRVGTPLTHERFLRRYRGSYGPALAAGRDPPFPFPSDAATVVDGLSTCGDSNFPGVGVPAVAGSGLLAAHSVDLRSVLPQLRLLRKLKRS